MSRGYTQPLTRRLPAFDSIAHFEDAAVARIMDARSLRSRKRHFWAIYTLGYAVEMCLKSAFFRLYGLDDSDDAGEALRIARPWGKTLGVQNAGQHLHDLLFWLQLIFAERNFLCRPVSQLFGNQISARVEQVARHWKPAMRYHSPVMAQKEVREVSAATSWIVQNRTELWS